MTNVNVCIDASDAVELFVPHGLYLKPIARLNVTVQLPQLKEPGKSISNWEVMEKLKKMIRPDTFIVLRIAKSTLEFIRFEGEIENKGKLVNVIGRLDCKTIKLSGFPDSLKVRAAEAKPNFPLRHDWESYFRDARHMNEMCPGERPDTVHVQDVPSRWFANRRNQDKDKPSEYVLKKVFETFGEIRCCDIPMLDPYRKEMSQKASGTNNIQTFTFGQDINFEAYIQYKEYISFVKAMSAIRGMKLLYKEDDKAWTAAIKVDFDKTKHLSDKSLKRRKLEREKLMALEKEKEERVRREREEEERRRQEERARQEEEERERERKRQEKIWKREERRKEREDRRRLRRVEKRRKAEEKAMAMKIAVEERKILIAQRKLETIRLLSELFTRVKVIKQREEVEKREKELEEESERQVKLEKEKKLLEEKRKLESERKKKDRLERQEKELRDKILRNMKEVKDRKLEKEREALRKKVSGKIRLKSTITIKR